MLAPIGADGLKRGHPGTWRNDGRGCRRRWSGAACPTRDGLATRGRRDNRAECRPELCPSSLPSRQGTPAVTPDASRATPAAPGSIRERRYRADDPEDRNRRSRAPHRGRSKRHELPTRSRGTRRTAARALRQFLLGACIATREAGTDTVPVGT
jgi:hypothetical protein